jgi:hypothetical protein
MAAQNRPSIAVTASIILRTFANNGAVDKRRRFQDGFVGSAKRFRRIAPAWPASAGRVNSSEYELSLWNCSIKIRFDRCQARRDAAGRTFFIEGEGRETLPQGFCAELPRPTDKPGLQSAMPI